MGLSPSTRIRVLVTGARGGIGLDIIGAPTPGQYVAFGANPRVVYPSAGTGGGDAALRTDLGQNAFPIANKVSGSFASFADLVANVPVNGTMAYVSEPGKEGIFVWRTGNYSALASADPNGGIYRPSTVNNNGATVGCWVRHIPSVNVWFDNWFGVPGDPAGGGGGSGAVQCHTQFSAMLNLANLLKPSAIMLGSKVYTLGAALPYIDFETVLIGARGAQRTILVKDYVESDGLRGVIAGRNYAVSARDIDIRARSGSGGSGFSLVMTNNSPMLGMPKLEGVNISGGNFFNYSLVMNGQTNTTVPVGLRNLFTIGCQFFGAANSSLQFTSVHHWLASSTFIDTSGGSGIIALQSNSIPAAMNDDWQFQGVISGVVNLNGLTRSNFVSPQIGNINIDANCSNVMWTGPRVAGVVTSATVGAFIASWDGQVVARAGGSDSGWRKWGDGRIEQWGAQMTNSVGLATNIALPMSFTSSNIAYSSAATSDPGSNLVTIANVMPGADPLTQYSVKAANLNYATNAVAPAASTAIRWHAHGQ